MGNIRRATLMACLITNKDTEQLVKKNDITKEKIGAENPLGEYLFNPNNNSFTKQQSPIYVKWPETLSTNSSSWLSTRRLGPEKITNTNNCIEKEADGNPQSGKRITDNPWSDKKAIYNPWLINRGMNLTCNLGSSVEGTKTREELKEKKVDSRIPLPMSDVVSNVKETDEEAEDKQVLRKTKNSVISGTGANLVGRKNGPWIPKSLPREGKLGLLKTNDNLNKSLLDDVAESNMERDSLLKLVEPLAENNMKLPIDIGSSSASANDNAKESNAAINVGNWILTDTKTNHQKMNFMAASQRNGSLPKPSPAGKYSMEIQAKPWVPKSLAEKVRIGLLRSAGMINEEDTNSENTTKEIVSIDSTSSSSIQGTLPNASPIDAEHSQDNLDTWIMDDNQSEASIITLDTITDNGDMDDFDDFADMEHELSIWISKA